MSIGAHVPVIIKNQGNWLKPDWKNKMISKNSHKDEIKKQNKFQIIKLNSKNIQKLSYHDKSTVCQKI